MNGLVRELLAAHRMAAIPKSPPPWHRSAGRPTACRCGGLQSVTVGYSHDAPDPAGRSAIIVPLANDGRIFDLAATGFASRRSATWTGLGAILGQAALDRALVHRAPCVSSAIPSNGCNIVGAAGESWLIEWPPNTAAPSGEDAAQRPLGRQRTHRGGSVPCSGR